MAAKTDTAGLMGAMHTAALAHIEGVLGALLKDAVDEVDLSREIDLAICDWEEAGACGQEGLAEALAERIGDKIGKAVENAVREACDLEPAHA